MKPPTVRRRVLAPAVLVSVALAVSLGACGQSTATGAAATTTTTTGGAAGSSPRSFPGASGSVAALSSSSMEVQNPESGQVTVSWTGSTKFSHDVTVPATSVVAGDCVTVTGSSSKNTITAKTVTVSSASSGKCTGARFGGGGFGGFGGGHRPSGAGSGGFKPPSGGSGKGPSGTGGTRPRGFGGAAGTGFASGKVTSVTPTSLVISGFSSASLTKKPAATSKSAPKAKPKIKTTTVQVKIASSTTYTEDKTAASSNLAVGDCVTAAGKSNSTGAVKATTVLITSTGHKTCTTGFGGFGGGSSA